MCLNCGQMDREIVIQSATRSKDAVTGQDLLTWDTGETIWARWLPAGTRETWQARQIYSTIDGVYQIHFMDGISPDTNRIIGHDGRTYDVKPPIEVGYRESLSIPVVARGEL